MNVHSLRWRAPGRAAHPVYGHMHTVKMSVKGLWAVGRDRAVGSGAFEGLWGVGRWRGCGESGCPEWGSEGL